MSPQQRGALGAMPVRVQAHLQPRLRDRAASAWDERTLEPRARSCVRGACQPRRLLRLRVAVAPGQLGERGGPAPRAPRRTARRSPSAARTDWRAGRGGAGRRASDRRPPPRCRRIAVEHGGVGVALVGDEIAQQRKHAPCYLDRGSVAETRGLGRRLSWGAGRRRWAAQSGRQFASIHRSARWSASGHAEDHKWHRSITR